MTPATSNTTTGTTSTNTTPSTAPADTPIGKYQFLIAVAGLIWATPANDALTAVNPADPANPDPNKPSKVLQALKVSGLNVGPDQEQQVLQAITLLNSNPNTLTAIQHMRTSFAPMMSEDYTGPEHVTTQLQVLFKQSRAIEDAIANHQAVAGT
ncbi:MAG TPA: hypothetical protein VN924_22005 [Bryobacteraceae bacterium]|nr:hypothetical protein [Bryobacteraceae bacterium]